MKYLNQQCVGTQASRCTAITKYTICTKGLINIIFGQQLRSFLNYIRSVPLNRTKVIALLVLIPISTANGQDFGM